MKRHMSPWLALLTALILALGTGLSAAETQSAEETELFGSPWINSNVGGNLPAEAPSPRDDLYLSVNYDSLAAHQEDMFYVPMSMSAQLQPAVMELIHDESFTAPGMDQLRIFWQQAADDETLKAQGLDEAMAYIARIQAAGSIAELNEVLLADDFPFSPYLFLSITPESLRGSNIAFVMPALALSDDPMLGIEAYNAPLGTVDEFGTKLSQLNRAMKAMPVLLLIGVPAEETAAQALNLFNTEFAYAGFYPRTESITTMEYGSAAKSAQIISSEEAETICSAFPLMATLKKFGKDASPAFYVATREWLTALDGLWTEENLETLKTLTAYKVMMECANYVSQEFFNKYAQVPVIAEGNAWNACDRAPTFSALLGQLYAENILGSSIRDKLVEVTNGLLGEYRELFNETEWVSEATRAAALEKVDNMQLNILRPKNGYLDFSGLQLKTAEEGGTLLGNYLAIRAYRNELENRMIGQPATPDLFWRISSPSMVNCFYDPASNSINILPNFISPVNWFDGISEMQILGGIGTVIGHELGHGFDFMGSQLNAYGEPEPILLENDVENFMARVDKIEEYFNGITVLPGVPTDGNRMRVENGADLTGMRVALSLAASQEGMNLKEFFSMYASQYLQVLNISVAPMMLTMDTHAPNYLRVNVICQMMPEYAETYGVTEGDGMYVKPEDRLIVWGK